MSPRLRRWLKDLAIKTGSIKVLRKVRDTIAPPAQVDYRLLERTGDVPVPTSVTMEVTLACNLHCTMCFQNDYRDRGIAKELGTDGLLQVVGRFPPDIRFAYFLGGEVFLRRGFPRLLEAVDAQGIETFITTNATRISPDDWAALNRARHLTGLGVSIDGVGAVHDAIRGQGTYEAIIANVRRALAKQRVYISFVMMESNFRQMPEFARAMTDLGIKEIGFVHEMYCLAHDVEATRRRLGWTEQDEIMMTVKETDWKPDAVRELLESLAAMPSLERRLGFVAAFEPPLPSKTLPALYDGTIRSTTRLFCRELTNLYLDPSGNVVHCGFLRRKFGNVLEQPIEAIWNSASMREFRKTLLDGNLLPVCRRCCKLSVWPDDGAAPLQSQEADLAMPTLMMPARVAKGRSGREDVRAGEASRVRRT
jgi:radical SAM protein with 4Fe4S-binding SPASM domain